jgi:cell division control protein 6
MHYHSVFKDETKLDINYVPPLLHHRGDQLNLLDHFFRFAVESPGRMTQRVLVVGKVGTGKTVLSQHFGLKITREAERRNINLKYIHVNCRECKGSLFMILQRTIQKFIPHFPRRGYSAEELLQALMQILDEERVYLILALDELEALIGREGADPIYNLTRIHEDRLRSSQRLSLICILRQIEYLQELDPSSRSTLQRNIIHLEEYTKSKLEDILKDRVNLAFHRGTISPQTVNLLAESADSEGGNARYAIELLWRAGKYADAFERAEVSPECVRKAMVSVYPVVTKNSIHHLSHHEKLFLLGVARRFKQTGSAYLPMGEAEEGYEIICEEYGEAPRGHTQLWKYVKNLSAVGILEKKISGVGRRGKTTLISLPRVPASDLEQELTKMLRDRYR